MAIKAAAFALPGHVDILPPNDGSPDAAPGASDHLDVCLAEGAESEAANGGRLHGDGVPRRHHDRPRAHRARGQKSVLGVRHR